MKHIGLAWIEKGTLTEKGTFTVPVPQDWKVHDVTVNGVTLVRGDRSSVMVSGTVEKDGRRWLHLSMAHPALPITYTDLAWLKRTFCGGARRAIQVFAREAEHVNLHPNCYHLWCCYDDDGLPDFRDAVSESV